MGENIRNDNTKRLRRDLKRAKVFSIHYLTRRIRLLKNKRGTEQQIEKNTRKAGRFQEEIECIKDLDVSIVLKKIEDKLDIEDITKNGSQDVQERVLARLMSSKPIQNRLKDTTDKKDISRLPDTADVFSNTKIRQKNNAKPSWTKSKSKNQNLTSDQQILTSSDDALEVFDSSEENLDEVIGMKGMSTSFFVESMASFVEDDDDDDDEDEDETKRRKEKKDKKGTKKASNRLGQRARQRLWEERYGNRANHVKSDVKIKTTRKREKLKADQKRTKQAKIAKPKKSVQETTSHPSWEASKRRKLERDISQTQFQGKKITFEDSD